MDSINKIKQLIPNDETIFIKELCNEKGLSKEKCAKYFQGNAGIYAFWWMKPLDKEKLNFQVEYKAPHNPEKQYIQSEWEFNFANGKFQSLYIGKTTTLINRLSWHLMLDTNEWYNETKMPKEAKGRWEKNKKQIFKRNSQCQFRAGFEHLIKNINGGHIDIMKNSVGITFIPEEKFEDRFYIEDLAIGYYRPWFNLDSER